VYSREIPEDLTDSLSSLRTFFKSSNGTSSLDAIRCAAALRTALSCESRAILIKLGSKLIFDSQAANLTIPSSSSDR
jgi:hypothetical protein